MGGAGAWTTWCDCCCCCCCNMQPCVSGLQSHVSRLQPYICMQVLLPLLRSFTCVAGVSWPPEVEAYLGIEKTQMVDYRKHAL